MGELFFPADIPEWLTIFLAQGLGGGINTVLPLVPQIGMMYLFLSFLEDSGYMARAAFVMDRLMQALGLPLGVLLFLCSPRQLFEQKAVYSVVELTAIFTSVLCFMPEASVPTAVAVQIAMGHQRRTNQKTVSEVA